jgi:hypothetical protein
MLNESTGASSPRTTATTVMSALSGPAQTKAIADRPENKINPNSVGGNGKQFCQRLGSQSCK